MTVSDIVSNPVLLGAMVLGLTEAVKSLADKAGFNYLDGYLVNVLAVLVGGVLGLFSPGVGFASGAALGLAATGAHTGLSVVASALQPVSK